MFLLFREQEHIQSYKTLFIGFCDYFVWERSMKDLKYFTVHY